MALLDKRKYQKQEPFRDAVIFIIICEGEKREPDYFRFFDRLTHQLKVIPIANQEGRSAPNHLKKNAEQAVGKYNSDGGEYELWFVLDIDRWESHIHSLHKECATKSEWNIAISNPCFEVWLYFHFKEKLPDIAMGSCSNWKRLIPTIKKGGFNSTKHPTLIRTAIKNSKKNYSGNGYLPDIGSTQLYILGEKLYTKTEKILSSYD
ncbi:MAG: RloB family protein [Bacteroidales bacterium]